MALLQVEGHGGPRRLERVRPGRGRTRPGAWSRVGPAGVRGRSGGRQGGPGARGRGHREQPEPRGLPGGTRGQDRRAARAPAREEGALGRVGPAASGCTCTCTWAGAARFPGGGDGPRGDGSRSTGLQAEQQRGRRSPGQQATRLWWGPSPERDAGARRQTGRIRGRYTCRWPRPWARGLWARGLWPSYRREVWGSGLRDTRWQARSGCWRGAQSCQGPRATILGGDECGGPGRL